MENLKLSLAHFFDSIHHKWESKKTHRWISFILVISFLISLFAALLYQIDWIPDNFKHFLPNNIFQSIQISFTLLLLIEVIGLVFSIAYSVTSSLVKQLEILSLILLRNAFKLFGEFSMNEDWSNLDPIVTMLSEAFGAAVIFSIILLINKTLKHAPITDDPGSQSQFIIFKKITALILFFVFISSGFTDMVLYIKHAQAFNFFKTFYTILIFTDIFLVLLSMRYNYSFIVVFRNSAYAVATIIIRMALSAPNYYNIVLGVLASLFILFVSFFYTKYRNYDSNLY